MDTEDQPPLKNDRPTAMSRRDFLGQVALATGYTAAAAAIAATPIWWPGGSGARRAASRPLPARRSALEREVLPNGMSLPTAAWVAAENARPGTLGWLVTGPQVNHGIEGFADRTSAGSGDVVTLFVNTTAPTFHVEAYRMGWYQGLAARQIWVSPEVPGTPQPPSAFLAATKTVECHWAPSIRFGVNAAWPPGVYVLKLVGSGGQQQFVPLTVRDDSSTAAYVIQNSVTDWQAYNLWGNYSLYYGQQGRGQSYDTRSRMVSFDRPYPMNWANGAADLLGNELPLIMLAERHGLDVTYWTDIDLHQRPQLLTRHRALVSLGHDEYWSPAMRAGATAARDAGVNLVFFGANACFRRIRLEDSPTGPGRHEVCYKNASEDPLYHVDDPDVTANWPDPPAANPESELIGNTYQSNPVNANLLVSDASSWLFAGTGARDGDTVSGVVGSEYDSYQPGSASPANVQVLAHSPLVCRGQPGFSDITWYTAPSGAGVLATGTNWWISKLVDAPPLPPSLLPGPFAGVTVPITQMTENVLAAVGWEPAGRHFASVPNWRQYYQAGGPNSGQAGERAA
jgi:hypothetical protein